MASAKQLAFSPKLFCNAIGSLHIATRTRILYPPHAGTQCHKQSTKRLYPKTLKSRTDHHINTVIHCTVLVKKANHKSIIIDHTSGGSFLLIDMTVAYLLKYQVTPILPYFLVSSTFFTSKVKVQLTFTVGVGQQHSHRDIFGFLQHSSQKTPQHLLS